MLAVQGVVLVLVAVPFGLDASVGGVVLTIVLVAVLGGSLAAVSYALALTLKSEDAFAPLLNTVLFPVVLLSGILLPMTLAPGWLQAVSDVVPFSHIVDGARSLFAGDFGAPDVGWGALFTVVLAGLGAWYGTSQFRKESG
ncbi:ABC transporter permease [Klenkia terrae]|uniref:ABC transporter permease n=1 Tax=Klenkia terrae TaxID=1052259 RepID=UPI00361F0052